MNPQLQSQAVFGHLIDVLTLGISYLRLDDAESVLAALRALRPKMVELDTYEAWIAMRHGRWSEAIRLLGSLDANSQDFPLGKALLAMAQFATHDPSWELTANEVLQENRSPEGVALARLLLNPEEAAKPPVEEGAQASLELEPELEAEPEAVLPEQGMYMRA